MEFVLVEAARTPGTSVDRFDMAGAGAASLEFVNFYPEESGDAGSRHRWTGPSSVATLRMHVDRTTAHHLSFEVVGYSIDEDTQRPRIYVDGRLAESESLDGRWVVFIPENRMIGRLPTTVAIDTGSTFCAMESGLGDDRRHLGIAVRNVELS